MTASELADLPGHQRIFGVNHPHFKDKTVIDLCSGLGGLSTAARGLGMKPVAAMDNWNHAQTVYAHNFPETTLLKQSILDPAAMPTLARIAREEEGIDLLMGGPPCQGFSQIRNGTRDPDDPRNAIMFTMPKALRAVKPKAFLIENVPMVLGHEKGAFAKRFLQALARPGDGLHYRIAKRVYDAAAFGVPQQRRRTILIGALDGDASLHPPTLPDLHWYFSARRRHREVNSFSNEADEILLDAADARLVTASQALNDLPSLAAGAPNKIRPYRKTASGNAYLQEMRTRVQTVSHTGTPKILPATVRRLNKLRPGQCVDDLPPRDRHELGRRFFSAYRKLHPDTPATTLSTKYDCAYHYSATRSLSVREYARLQSIPDNIQFPVAARHAYALIGNAVPPLLAARALKSTLTWN